MKNKWIKISDKKLDMSKHYVSVDGCLQIVDKEYVIKHKKDGTYIKFMYNYGKKVWWIREFGKLESVFVGR